MVLQCLKYESNEGNLAEAALCKLSDRGLNLKTLYACEFVAPNLRHSDFFWVDQSAIEKHQCQALQ